MENQENVVEGQVTESENVSPVLDQPVVSQEPNQETVEAKPDSTVATDYTDRINKPVSEWNLTPEELADPKFEETLEQIRQGHLRQSDYTKKTQELSELKKKLWDPMGRQFTQEDINTLLQNPAFVQQAQSMIETTSQNQVDPSTMTDEQKQMHEFSQKLNQQQQALVQHQQFLYQQQLQSDVAKLDQKYGGNVSKKINEVESLRRGATNPRTPLTLEGAYKALNYDDDIKAALEEGKRLGMGIKQQKITKQPLSNTMPVPPHAGKETPRSIQDVTNQLKQQWYSEQHR